MKIFKKVLGILILLAIFGGFFAAVAIQSTLMVALIGFGIAIGLTALIWLAVNLLS